MESWKDKTKATHFNQQALVASFVNQDKFDYPYRLQFNGNFIKVLHYA